MLTPDRYNRSKKQRERVCRACELWVTIDRFAMSAKRRRRVCKTCRTDQTLPCTQKYRSAVKPHVPGD